MCVYLARSPASDAAAAAAAAKVTGSHTALCRTSYRTHECRPDYLSSITERPVHYPMKYLSYILIYGT